MCSFLAIFINEIKLALFLVYRPPPDYTSGNLYHGPHLEHSFNDIVINKINNTIANLNTPVPDIILAGDFNFPKASWHEGTGIHPQGNSPESRMLSQLIDTCETHQLFQKITFGTRPTPTGGSNTLDLLFTNNHLLINHISHRLSSLSDHAIITCHTAHNLPLNINPATPDTPNPTTLSSFNLNRGCKENISEAANSLEWDTIFHGKDNSEKRRTLETHMLEILEQNCPKYAHKPGQTRNKIPRDRRILFRQRKRKLKLKNSMTTGNTRILTLTNEILDIENKLVVSFKNERLAEENKAINNIKTNPKHFYSFARKHQIIKGGIGPLKVNDKLITSPQEICENLSAQYSSVYSQPDPSNAITDPISFFTLDNPDIPSLLDIEFSEQMIEEEIASLKNHSAPGPDHFPVLLLKTYKKELSKPIYMMWRESLDNHDIDPLLLHAIVCPVQKPGSETYHAKSYRPISLTSHIIKIFEKIVRKAIISHLVNNNLLPTNQHGFLQGRSTLSQLLNQVETITRILESGNDLDSVYLDFAKAFDKVDHTLLYKKLKSMRIGGKVGVWLHTFLSNRTQQVSANGAISAPSPVLSGVPQGTVLGPILFIIMISDLDSNLQKAFAALFADDSRISSIVASEEDSQNFQQELNRAIYPWATENKAVFNGDKFEHIHFGNKLDDIPRYQDPNGNHISIKPQIKDLGVLISNDLSWSPQVDKVISDCRKQAAWILRTFSKRDMTTMRTLWISLLRPIVDYCSPLWSPKPTNYGIIDRLEGTLRSFTKHVDGLHDYTYSERLKAMNLQSVQRRHERYKIIYIYKIKEGLVPNLPLDPSNPENSFALKFSTSLRGGCRCSLPNQTLYHNPAEIPRNSSFALTASNLWNCLPPNISCIKNCTIPSFKNKLDKFLDLFPDNPRCSATGLFTDPNTGRLSNSIWHMRQHPSIIDKINKFNKRLDIVNPLQGRASTR